MLNIPSRPGDSLILIRQVRFTRSPRARNTDNYWLSVRADANLRGVNVAPLLRSLAVIFSTPQFISTNARPHTNHLTLRCRSNVIVSSRS
jgi:hypothetical protein